MFEYRIASGNSTRYCLESALRGSVCVPGTVLQSVREKSGNTSASSPGACAVSVRKRNRTQSRKVFGTILETRLTAVWEKLRKHSENDPGRVHSDISSARLSGIVPRKESGHSPRFLPGQRRLIVVVPIFCSCACLALHYSR